ncbi:MAG: hypothetical protein ACKPKO_33425, partial [Candidatus Fonsibacter sp.]
ISLTSTSRTKWRSVMRHGLPDPETPPDVKENLMLHRAHARGYPPPSQGPTMSHTTPKAPADCWRYHHPRVCRKEQFALGWRQKEMFQR